MRRVFVTKMKLRPGPSETFPSMLVPRECVGVFMRRVFVTKMKLRPGPSETFPSMLVPRVW
ncbi:unnamed protein product [Plutella xylostella]|uniref:(diamondback moth) hypothetical protein n=1 Tax=Plutella xylostella TaxID=51655 RepID=A0A8S4DF86_PLUXY|nr:unnamed protein product [Plutella xylostella]